MIYLLDTDTVIYWMKGNKNISQKVIYSGFHAIAVSDITKAELYYGAYKSQRTDENLTAIKNIAERVSFLPFNDPAQSTFGKVKAQLEKAGRRLDDMDLMIASTALASSLILVTNNAAHFERITGLKVENWM
jgi:tRNA(fMet)-specific endonuclease VapC